MVSILKTELQYIQSGKIDVINVVTQEISKSRIMKLKQDTTVILVFDTDRAETEVLYKNIKFLRKQKELVSSVICVPQCKNLEDEII